MPIKFACKHCKTKLKMSSRLAGRAFECPKCGEKQRAPTPRPPGGAPSSADLAGVPVSQSKALLTPESPSSSAKQRPQLAMPPAQRQATTKPQPRAGGGLPFDDDEWDQALNPYEPPKEDDGPKLPGYDEAETGARALRRELRWVRRGLLLIVLGIWGGYASRLVLNMTIRFGAIKQEDFDAPGGLLLTLLCFGAFFTVLTGIGPYLCITIPEKSGARRTALTAATAQSVFVVCEVYASFLPDNPENLDDSTAILIVGLASVAVSYMTFVEFMKQLGCYINRRDLVDKAQALTLLGVANFLLLVASPVCLYLGATIEGMGWLLIVGGVCAIAIWFGLFIAFFSYAGLVGKLSEAIPQ